MSYLLSNKSYPFLLPFHVVHLLISCFGHLYYDILNYRWNLVTLCFSFNGGCLQMLWLFVLLNEITALAGLFSNSWRNNIFHKMTIFNDIKACYGFLLCNFYSVRQLILALLCQNLKSGFMKRLEINKCGAKANCLFFLQFGPYLCVSFSSFFFFIFWLLTWPTPIPSLLIKSIS